MDASNSCSRPPARRREVGWLPRAAAALVVVGFGWKAVAHPSPVTPSPAAPSESEEAAERHGSAFIDPLGFLLFGPSVGVEAGAGRVTGALYGRWFNAGLVAHHLFLNEGDAFAFSAGVGLRGRYYLSDGLAGAHLGVAVEYLRSRVDNATALIETTSGYFIPSAEAGYRFSLGRLYVDASAGLGYAFKLSGQVDNLPGGTTANTYQPVDESSLYGAGRLDLGVYF